MRVAICVFVVSMFGFVGSQQFRRQAGQHRDANSQRHRRADGQLDAAHKHLQSSDPGFALEAAVPLLPV
jgi:hypothetical protein